MKNVTSKMKLFVNKFSLNNENYHEQTTVVKH